MFERWKKAVIHLECATDSDEYIKLRNQTFEIMEMFENGKIGEEEYIEKISKGGRDARYQGTALYITHNGLPYLLTARHVIYDEIEAERRLSEEIDRIKLFPEEDQADLLARAQSEHERNIFNMIFRVPSINEVIDKETGKTIEKNISFLMNLGAGPSWLSPYTFSDPNLDLAVICLEGINKGFVKEFESLGFAPISSDDIADGPDYEGQDVFTVGFPRSSAFLGNLNLSLAKEAWASNDFSVPVFSFGKVSMLNDMLHYFLADMSIYPGNSGGPVIANDKLVGIVSGQSFIHFDDLPDDLPNELEFLRQVTLRIPFGHIIKTSYIRELLNEQEKKTTNFKDIMKSRF